MDLAKLVKILPAVKCPQTRHEEEMQEEDEPPPFQRIEFCEPSAKQKREKKNKEPAFFNYSISLPEYAAAKSEAKPAKIIEYAGDKPLIEYDEVIDSDPPYSPGIEFFIRALSVKKVPDSDKNTCQPFKEFDNSDKIIFN
jgi:hypothetical protein